MKKYFISCDLEQTGHFQHLGNSRATTLLESIRSNTKHLIENTFSQVECQMIAYDKIVDFFEQKRSKDECILSLDNGLYIHDADVYFDSTRVYHSQESIGLSGENYKVKKRDGSDLGTQISQIVDVIEKSGKKKIVICDDGIFSGNTLRDVIQLLQKYGIIISQVRTVLNLSGGNTIAGIPIQSLYFETEFVDWLDERDLFYGVCMSGATFQNRNGEINGLPYIDSQTVAIKKASVPQEISNHFCKIMTEQNIYYFQKVEDILGKKVSLQSLPRISYLTDFYHKDINICELLYDKKNTFSF